MRKITFTILLIIGFKFGFSQIVNYDFNFETGTTLGAWNYFENGTDTSGVKFVANPFPGGVNTSATVAKFTASHDGTEWSGCETLYGTLGKWKFDGTTPTTVTIDVYKTTFTPVYIKFTSTNNSGQGTTFIGNKIPTAINQWVTLTFIVDFSQALINTGNGTGGGGINNSDNNAGNNQIVFHVDRDAKRSVDHVVYFDNIKFTATKMADPIVPPAPIAPPTVHAPTPPARNSSDVISVYSGKYNDLTGTKIGKNWGEATKASDILVDGDLTKQLLQFNYQGIVLASSTNITGFEKIHIDFYKTDQAQIKLSILHQGGADITKLLNITNQGWNSFDIPLTDFPGLNLATVYQLKLEGAPKQGNTTVFFDNLYFYKGTVASGLTKANQPKPMLYPNPTNNSVNIIANGLITNLQIINSLGQEVLSLEPGSNTIILQTDQLAKGTYCIKMNIDGVVSISKFEKE